MSDPFTTASSDFNDTCVGAEALFFVDKYGTKSLRLEAQDLALEFTDGLYIGTDPQGTLYYTEGTDFKSSGINKYTVKSVIYNKTNYATIDFWKDGETTVYARFVAKDKKDAVKMMSPPYTGGDEEAKWIDLAVVTANAIIKKTSSTNITVTIPTISKTATITLSNPTWLSSNFGLIRYKDAKKINDGKYANYNNDRIVFYEDNYVGTDFTAFFIPLVSETTSLGLSADSAFEFNDVKWSG